MKKLFSLFAAFLFVGSMWAINGEIATSITAGDQVVIINKDANKELTGVSSNIGTQASYTGTPNGTCILTVEEGLSGSGYSFKMSNGDYLALTVNDNKLNTLTITGSSTATQKKQASWTVSINGDTKQATITNVNATSRVLKYNSSNPRFCCYTSGQQLVKIFKVAVSSVATPTITPAKGSFQGSVEVTLACETDGATIYYTTDATKKDAPSTSTWTAYDGEDKPSYDATTTIYAAAIKDAEWSSVISKTFTLYPTEMTCAEARTAALSVSANNIPYAEGLSFTVHGFVTSTPNFDSSNEYVTYYIADTRDGDNVLQVFRAVCADESHVPAEGDIVDVTGQLTKYGSTPEFAAGATYVVTKLPYVTPELTSWNFGDDIEQGTIGSDDTQHLLKTISLTGANLTADVRLDVVTTGGGDIFFLNGYKSYITLSPEEGEINYDICAIASTSTAGSFAGTITISSLKATPEFEPVVIDLSITVLAPIAVTSVTLNKNATSIEEGQTETLTATVLPANATNKAVTWESDNTDVATVDENGVVAAVAPGTATITCSSDADDTKYDECVVTVTEHIIIPGTYDSGTTGYAFWGLDAEKKSATANEVDYNAKVNDVTVNIKNNTKTNAWFIEEQTRLYDAYTMTFSVPTGYSLTAIVFTPDAGNNWSGDHTASTGTMTDNKNWTGKANSVTITFKGTCRLVGMSVTFTKDAATAIDNTEVEGKAVKVLRDGILLIEKNGHTYNAQGQLVK